MPKAASPFFPMLKGALAVESEEVEAVPERRLVPKINGPFVFLKIEGDKHFLPPS